MRVCHAQIIFVSDLKAATKSLELELPTEDNKCSWTHYHESQIISSSQTTMPVAFFTLQDSFFLQRNGLSDIYCPGYNSGMSHKMPIVHRMTRGFFSICAICCAL